MKNTACFSSFVLLKIIYASSAWTYCKTSIIKEENTGTCTTRACMYALTGIARQGMQAMPQYNNVFIS